MPNSIVEALAVGARRNPERLCLADATVSLTYAQAWDCVRNACERISEQGVRADDAVVIECDQSVRYLITMFAVQLAGAISVPLEKNAALERRVEIARETKAALYIGKEQLEELDDIPFSSKDADSDPTPNHRDFPFPAAENVAEILFSTGTTGKSKGIVLTHRNNTAIAENVIEGVRMKPDNVEVIPMPLSHSHGLRRSYANIYNGSSVVIADGVLALKRLFNLMDEHRATALDLSPAMLSIIFKLSKERIGEYADSLDYIQLGSAPLAEDDKEHLARLLPRTRLYNFYGSTEAGCSCLLEFGQAANRPHCIGMPAVNAQFVVVDENRNVIESSPEHLGFLASSGPINMREYYKAPELTRETMADGFIYTKDLGYIDEEGFVYMLGRADDVINFGGVKVSPEEIESAVGKNPIVKDCACIPISDELAGQVPILCISLEDGSVYDVKSFKQYLLEVLDANKQPQRVEVVEEIPRTFNGKIRRNYLIARFDES